MKKVALSLLAFGLVGAMAFADNAAPTVAIHDWGRQLFAVGNQDSQAGNGYYMGLGTSWGANPRIVGLNITGQTDTAGFSITPDADANGTFGLTDQNKAWINPFPGVTVEAGISLETDTWRGTADYGTWDWLRLPGTHGDSFTFSRIGEGGLAEAVEYNKDGIGAWALIQNSFDAKNNGLPATDIGSNIQVGAAYTVPSIGVIKAQALGTNVNSAGPLTGSVASDKYTTIQAAFNLTAVQNLYEEVGVWVPSDASKAGWGYSVADSLSYKLGAPTLHGRVLVVGFNDKNNVSGLKYASSDMGLEAGVGIDYALDGGLTASANFDYVNKAARNGGKDTGHLDSNGKGDYVDAAVTGFGAYLSKGFSNGMIGFGFEYSSTNWNGGNTTGTGDVSASHWAIPVKMEEWF